MIEVGEELIAHEVLKFLESFGGHVVGDVHKNGYLTFAWRVVVGGLEN
jgi:hypothetical protein